MNLYFKEDGVVSVSCSFSLNCSFVVRENVLATCGDESLTQKPSSPLLTPAGAQAIQRDASFQGKSGITELLRFSLDKTFNREKKLATVDKVLKSCNRVTLCIQCICICMYIPFSSAVEHSVSMYTCMYMCFYSTFGSFYGPTFLYNTLKDVHVGFIWQCKCRWY